MTRGGSRTSACDLRFVSVALFTVCYLGLGFLCLANSLKIEALWRPSVPLRCARLPSGNGEIRHKLRWIPLQQKTGGFPRGRIFLSSGRSLEGFYLITVDRSPLHK
jgi:hypothetical protein